MTSEQHLNMYFNHLYTEGFAPQIEEDNRILFRFHGKSYYILIDPKDPMFLRILYVLTWEKDPTVTDLTIINAANQATAGVKFTKISYIGEHLIASIETFCTPEEFQFFFKRSLELIDFAVHVFFETLKE